MDFVSLDYFLSTCTADSDQGSYNPSGDKESPLVDSVFISDDHRSCANDELPGHFWKS